jgi:hypothetical protein
MSSSILKVLALVHARPSMYLGWDDDAPRQRLHALQALITGYTLAVHHHANGDDIAVVAELEEFLRQQSGADSFCGIDQILATSMTEPDAWDRVWSLIAEFREAKSRRL